MFNNYNHFKNYCLKIASNKGYVVDNQQLKIFEKFEVVTSLLEELSVGGVIRIENNIYDIICKYFKSSYFEKVFNNMRYFVNKINKFHNEEVDFYYITTSFNSMFNLGVYFEEEFLLNKESKFSKFYPCSVKGLEVKKEIEKIYVVNEIDIDYKNKYGLYFIYDEEEDLVYIGKSSSCLLTRSFQSVKERNVLSFSRIEFRECNAKSDIAIYESYYISIHKPKFNSDLVFEDMPSVTLPELNVSKVLSKGDSSGYVTYEYTYLNSRTMKKDEFIELKEEGVAWLDTIKNRMMFNDKGIYLKAEMKAKAYQDTEKIIKSKDKNCIIISKFT